MVLRFHGDAGAGVGGECGVMTSVVAAYGAAVSW